MLCEGRRLGSVVMMSRWGGQVCWGVVAILLVLVAGGEMSAKLRARDVDFQNFTYGVVDDFEGVPEEWFWDYPVGEQKTVTLVDGMHSFKDPGEPAESWGFPYLRFVSAQYGKLRGEREEVAAVVLNYSTGGTANWSYLYIFEFGEGKPVLLARLEAGSGAYGGLVAVKFERGDLVLDFADAARAVGDCCSEGYVRVRYRLKKSGFVQMGTVVRGSVDVGIIKGPKPREDPAADVVH